MAGGSIGSCFRDSHAQERAPTMDNTKSLMVRIFFVLCCGTNDRRTLERIRRLWNQLKTSQQFIRFVNSDYLSNARHMVLPASPRGATIIEFLQAFLDATKKVYEPRIQNALNENLQKLLGDGIMEEEVRFDFPVHGVQRITNQVRNCLLAMDTMDHTLESLVVQSFLAAAATNVSIMVSIISWQHINESAVDSRNMIGLLTFAAVSWGINTERFKRHDGEINWGAVFRHIILIMATLSSYMLFYAQEAPWKWNVSNMEQIGERVVAALLNHSEIPEEGSHIFWILNSIMKYFVPMFATMYLMFFPKQRRGAMMAFGLMSLIPFTITLREGALTPGNLTNTRDIWHKSASKLFNAYNGLNNEQMLGNASVMGAGLKLSFGNGEPIVREDEHISTVELTAARIVQRDIGIGMGLLLALSANFHEVQFVLFPEAGIYPANKSDAMVKENWPSYHAAMDKYSAYNLNSLFRFLDTNYLMYQIKTLWKQPFVQKRLTGREWNSHEIWTFENNLELFRPTITGVVNFMTTRHVTPKALSSIKTDYHVYSDKYLKGMYYLKLIVPEILNRADEFLFKQIRLLCFEEAKDVTLRDYYNVMYGKRFFEGYSPINHPQDETAFRDRMNRLIKAYQAKDFSKLDEEERQSNPGAMKSRRSIMAHLTNPTPKSMEMDDKHFEPIFTIFGFPIY